MTHTLSARDLAALAECSRQILSALDGPSPSLWAGRVIRVVKPLIRADRMFIALPDKGSIVLHHSDAEMAAAAVAYESHYHKTDRWTGPRRRALNLDVYSFEMLTTARERALSEFWNDWILAYHLHSPAGISHDVAGCPVPATLIGYKEASTTAAFSERELRLLQLLEPSFDAAVKVIGQFERIGQDLLAYVDAHPAPTLLIGAAGPVHRNRSFVTAAGDEAEEVISRVLPSARALLNAVHSMPPLGGTYTLRTGETITWHLGLFSSAAEGPLALVHFDLPRPIVQLSEEARAGFKLTERQARVAEMMARGWTYREIAEHLGIRPATARRHCENVLQRLGIHSRRDVLKTIQRP